MLKKPALFLLVLLALPSLWAQNRYALVIGNAQYPRVDDRLPNAINDTNDISSALRGLGYDVVLRQNLQYLDMVREVETFTNRLRNNRNSEGFFWYAGHAMEVEGESLLLPLNVDLGSDSLIRATSYSVTNLTRQLNAANNKLNVVVLDACRIPPAVGGGARSMGDTSRVIRTVPSVPADLFVIYSTAPGETASDGTGSRNSPFTQAFLSNINKPEPLSLLVEDITRDTMALTNQRQRPYTTGSIVSETRYSLNPSGAQPAPSPTPSPTPSPAVAVPAGLEYEILDGWFRKFVQITKYTGSATSVNIPAQIQGFQVESIGESAFAGCVSLSSITIPSTVNNIYDRAFEGCSGLTSVIIPSSVGWVGNYAFLDCDSLISITIPSTLALLGDMAFSGCDKLTSIIVDSNNPSFTSIDGVLFRKDLRTILCYPIGKTARSYSIPSSVTTIGFGAFAGSKTLTTVTIPSSVYFIKERAFASCSALTSVTIPSSVLSIDDSAFRACVSLTSVNIPSSVQSVGEWAFMFCDKLTSATISRQTQFHPQVFPALTRITYSD
jgi:hypothetical protein